MNWGKWIVVSFILFAAFIATLVTVCVRQDISLVSKDYYQEELVYQSQITRINNTERLQNKPVIEILDNRVLTIDFASPSKIQKGELKLFRPSNAKLDKIYTLKSAEGKESFDISELSKGMYKVKLSWTMQNKEYYLEEVIYI